jgi:hypothetical protein
LSLSVSTQTSAQRVSPDAQLQVPSRHDDPLAHALPHAPQLLRSEVVLEQPPPHAVVGGGHLHEPFAQPFPPVHT